MSTNKANKQTIVLSAKVEDDKLILDNGIGNRWDFPANFSRPVALASLVYGALMNKDNTVSCYADKYRISIEVEILDHESY